MKGNYGTIHATEEAMKESKMGVYAIDDEAHDMLVERGKAKGKRKSHRKAAEEGQADEAEDSSE